MRKSGKRVGGFSRARVLGTIAVVAAAWLVVPKVLATDPDGVTTPTFTGEQSGVAAQAAGTVPLDGVNVDVSTGELRFSVDTAEAAGVMMPFHLGLNYCSQSLYDGYDGVGWTSILDWTCTKNGSGDLTFFNVWPTV